MLTLHGQCFLMSTLSMFQMLSGTRIVPLLMRFLVSNVYLGPLHLPQDDIINICCPICEQLLSRQHVLTECCDLLMERDLLR